MWYYSFCLKAEAYPSLTWAVFIAGSRRILKYGFYCAYMSDGFNPPLIFMEVNGHRNRTDDQ